MSRWQFWIDRGGTFTDVVARKPDGTIVTHKLLSENPERYGDAGIEADLEILRLLCSALQLARVRNARIAIGHVAVFRSLARAAQAGPELEAQLFEALQRKDVPELRNLARALEAKIRSAILLLPELYGGPEVLAAAEKKLPRIAGLSAALATLRKLARACKLPVSFDLAELRGYHYHSGVVFDAYCDAQNGAASFPIARGGRYDQLYSRFGRATAAIGSRPSSLAQRHTSPSIARLESPSKPFSTQKEAGTPSGTNANVNSVNRGP